MTPPYRFEKTHHAADVVACTHPGLHWCRFVEPGCGVVNVGALGRPANERPFLLLVVGHPAADARVPDITKKPLERIATFL